MMENLLILVIAKVQGLTEKKIIKKMSNKDLKSLEDEFNLAKTNFNCYEEIEVTIIVGSISKSMFRLDHSFITTQYRKLIEDECIVKKIWWNEDPIYLKRTY